MKYSILFASLVTVFGLSACDRPTVVNNPSIPVAVPGPAGPQGQTGTQGSTGFQGDTGRTGSQGAEGVQGETGKTGNGTVVIVPVPSEQK